MSQNDVSGTNMQFSPETLRVKGFLNNDLDVKLSGTADEFL